MVSSNLKSPLAAALGGIFLLVAGAAPLRGQSYSITNISVPDNFPVTVNALNAAGQVTGSYQTPTGSLAFLWQNGVTLNLGTLGGTISVGNGVNNLGQVVGFSTSIGDTATRAFLAIGTTLFDLTTLGGVNSSATAISDAGFVTGSSDVTPGRVDAHAFLFNGVRMLDLGTLGGSFSAGFAVNNTGQVAGDSTTDASDAFSHAFLYNGSLVDLGTLGGAISSAAGLNASGQITGDAETTRGEIHAFFFDGTSMRDLGTLGGTFSSAYVINDAGQIMGDAETADGENHAFLYNGTMVDLGTLGGDFSTPFMLNNSGQVVGFARNALNEQRAFLWQNGTMRDLNTLLPANSGWTLTTANFINDAGQIAGVGSYLGQSAYYLLTPQAGQNHPPVAQAGPDQSVGTADTTALVTVDGSASSDPDGDALTYLWLEDGTSFGATARVTLPLALGSHLLTLRVTDPSGASADSSLRVTVVDTGVPVVQCPLDLSASADETGQAEVPDLVSNLVATDNGTLAENLRKTQTPPAGTRLGPGSSTIGIIVTDSAGNSATCSVGFTVSDVTVPRLICPDPITLNPQSGCQAATPDISPLVSASDNCTPAGQLHFTQNPAAGTSIGVGDHEVHVAVTDLAGNTAVCTVLVHVLDSLAPVIQSICVDQTVLHPANHQMVPVTLTAVVADNCDPAPVCSIVAVRSSEPVTGQADNTSPDWEITGPLTVNLRAEVTSNDAPRTYTICVACRDAAGNVSRANVTVTAVKNKNGL